MIDAPGGNKPCWDAVVGMPRRCAMLCGTMWLSIWPQTMRFSIRSLFTKDRVAASAGDFLDVLLKRELSPLSGTNNARRRR